MCAHLETMDNKLEIEDRELDVLDTECQCKLVVAQRNTKSSRIEIGSFKQLCRPPNQYHLKLNEASEGGG